LGGYQVNGIWTYDVGMNVTPYQLGYGAYGYVGMSDYCDTDFASAFNSAVSTCRPVSSNKNAPGNTSGIYINADSAANLGIASGYYDLGSIIDYQNGATDANLNPIMPVAKTKDQVRWLYNNTDLADLMGNPFPGNSRGSLRGNGWNNINANIFKNTTFHEKYTLQLQFMAYNALNKRLLGTPDPEIDDTLYGSETFWNNAYNSGTNARQVQLGARIIF
jgi:hypothetical protein